MRKLFICSDIHGFYNIFEESLKKAGYDKNNPSHRLIILGDFFDKGQEAKKIKDFMLKESEELGFRFMMIRGNHDDSLMRIYETGYLKSHNFTSGTYNTMEQLGETDSGEIATVLSQFRQKNKDLMDLYEKMPYCSVYDDILFVHSWVPDCKNILHASRDEWHTATLTSLTKKVQDIKDGKNLTNFYPYTGIKRVVFGHHKADDIKCMDDYEGPGVYTEAIKTLKSEYTDLTLYGVDGRVEVTGKIPVLILEV